MATAEGYLLSQSEQLFIRQGIVEGLRADGRNYLEYREIQVESNPVPQASGSARICIGDTQVLVSVKGDVSSEKGRLVFSVDSSSSSISQMRESDDRSYREEFCAFLAAQLELYFGTAFDCHQLIVAPNRYNWILYIDILIISESGNLMDVMALGVFTALSSTRLPKISIEEGESVGLSLSDDPADLQSLDCTLLPLSFTFAVFHNLNNCDGKSHFIIADANFAEEASADILFNVALNSKGQFVSTRKNSSPFSRNSSFPLSITIIEEILETSKNLYPVLVKALKDDK